MRSNKVWFGQDLLGRDSQKTIQALSSNPLQSSINLVAFSTNICFQMHLFIDNFEIKNKSLNKQVLLRDAPSCSIVLRSDPHSFVVLRYDLSCSDCHPLLHQCSLCDPLFRCSVAPFLRWSVLYYRVRFNFSKMIREFS